MAMAHSRTVTLTVALFVLNVALQIADGVATYVGCLAGWGEGNPLVRHAMEHFGLGTGLLLTKCAAIVFLGYLWVARRNRFVPVALGVTAAVYLAFSLLPWSVAFLALASV
jgi:hypothetical protein